MKKTYMNPTLEVDVLEINNSLLAGSPFREAETTSGPGLGDPEYFDDDEPGL